MLNTSLTWMMIHYGHNFVYFTKFASVTKQYVFFLYLVSHALQ